MIITNYEKRIEYLFMRIRNRRGHDGVLRGEVVKAYNALYAERAAIRRAGVYADECMSNECMS